MYWITWLILASTAIPMLKILPHFGINRYWAALCLIPIGLAVLIWWMAMKLHEMDRL